MVDCPMQCLSSVKQIHICIDLLSSSRVNLEIIKNLAAMSGAGMIRSATCHRTVRPLKTRHTISIFTQRAHHSTEQKGSSHAEA